MNKEKKSTYFGHDNPTNSRNKEQIKKRSAHNGPKSYVVSRHEHTCQRQNE